MKREPIFRCETCGTPICEGDRYHAGGDVDLCEDHAPSYADLLSSPAHFHGPDEKPLSAEGAKRIVDAHVSSGGLPTDKIVSEL